MRFVVYGAGAIGGVVGAQLHRAGNDVTLVARGPHYEAIRDQGLVLETPLERARFDIRVVADITDARVDDETVVLLTVKSQDTALCIAALSHVATRDTSVVCIQNGVENERMALRHFANVYGVSVMCPTAFLQPGVVSAYSAPVTGILDIGRYPGGTDETCAAVATEFGRATFVSLPRPDIMRWKYGKLIRNLRNAIEAVCGPEARDGKIRDLVTGEAEQVLDTAGIDYISEAEDRARRGDILTPGAVAGAERPGGSVWQSIARRTGTVETDYLSGQIVILGRLHGVRTPANELLQQLCAGLAAGVGKAGGLSESGFLDQLESRS